MKLNAIDVFAGCGGLSTGLEKAGINVQLAIEKNADAARTYFLNHPNTKVVTRDIREIKATEIRDSIYGELNMVTGGPPCQGFSHAGKRDTNDPRNYLFMEFHRLLRELKPQGFIFENVKGILSFNGGKTIKGIEARFKKLGYDTQLTVLNASHFGVPQNRERVFILGALDKPEMQIDGAIKKQGPISASEAISDLEFLKSGETGERFVLPARSDYQKSMRDTRRLHNHKAANHSETVMERFSLLQPGASSKFLPTQFKTKKNIQFRLHPNEPARTVTTLPEDQIHYSLNRILTVREVARLQSFPDSYQFTGPRTTGGLRRREACPQYTQVGNAVPPQLAKCVGKYASQFLVS